MTDPIRDRVFQDLVNSRENGYDPWLLPARAEASELLDQTDLYDTLLADRFEEASAAVDLVASHVTAWREENPNV